MKKNLPVILGMDPPTKNVVFMKTEKPLRGYAVIINHADFPEGTKQGDTNVPIDKIKHRGCACWLQFTDADTMRRFGQNLIDFANEEKL